MRATLNIPDDLLSEVMKITGEKSKTKAITVAMKEFVRQQKIKELLALRRKIKIEYDWKNEEELEVKHQKERQRISKGEFSMRLKVGLYPTNLFY